MNFDLFADNQPQWREEICTDAYLLHAFALPFETELLHEIATVISTAPLQKMYTSSGLAMSVTNTSCGEVGWVSDAYGYRYANRNAYSKQQWPAMPKSLFTFAQHAAREAGFNDFLPDSCLINCYKIGTKLSLHQDKNEKDFSQPIVSVSLGLPATFLLGGLVRESKTIKIPLAHGDVMVWGGRSRLLFHGVLPIRAGAHSLLGEQRINLTFRKAL